MIAGGPRDGGAVAQMQAYEDAICWRTGQLAAPCGECNSSAKVFCDQHAIDLHLIAGYKLAIGELAGRS
jgi:hypothetical protein